MMFRQHEDAGQPKAMPIDHDGHVPERLKPLFDPALSFADFWDTGAYLRYTYQIPRDERQLELFRRMQPYGLVDTGRPLKDLDSLQRHWIEAAFRFWEGVTKLRFEEVTFEENNLSFHFPITQFSRSYPKDSKDPYREGYVHPSADFRNYEGNDLPHGNISKTGRISLGIGLNKEFFCPTHPPCSYHALTQTITAYRLTGSLLMGLTLPSERKDFDPNSSNQSFSSIMEPVATDLDGFPVYPITPLRDDIAVAQLLFGVNPAKDKLCKIADGFLGINYDRLKTIATLPHCETLSAAGLKEKVRLDLRPNTRSALGNMGYVITTGVIKHAISSEGHNSIYLNPGNNIIDARYATRTTVILDPNRCGHDIHYGFPDGGLVLRNIKVEGHAALLTQGSLKTFYRLEEAQVRNVTLAGERLPDTFGAKIIFDKYNSIILAGVRPEEVTNSLFWTDLTAPPFYTEVLMEVNPQYKPAAKQAVFAMANQTHVNSAAIIEEKHEHPSLPLEENLKEVLEAAYFPSDFATDFLKAFALGAGLTFLTSLPESVMQRYQFTDRQIAVLGVILQFLLTWHLGSALASSASLMTSSFMKYFGFSNENSAWAGSVVSSAVNICEGSFSSADDLLRAGASLLGNVAGGFAGSRFSLWAKEKIVQPELRENKRYHSKSV